MYAFLPGFGVGVMAITMIPSLLALILVRLISNDNTYYKPFSKDEIKQTLFEIIAIAVLGPVALFAAFIIIGILGPFALFFGYTDNHRTLCFTLNALLGYGIRHCFVLGFSSPYSPNRNCISAVIPSSAKIPDLLHRCRPSPSPKILFVSILMLTGIAFITFPTSFIPTAITDIRNEDRS